MKTDSQKALDTIDEALSEHLKSMSEALSEETLELVLATAQGYAQALLDAEVITDKEYKEWSDKLEDAYAQRDEELCQG